jgi:hypothetical protein
MFYVHSPQTVSATGDGTGGALATATGYAVASLYDGTVEKGWRGSGSATTHYIALDLTDTSWDTIGLFDVKATDGTVPSSATLDMSATGMAGAWSGNEVVSINTSGDGWLSPVSTIRRYARIKVVFSSAKYLRVGEIMAGTKVTFSRGFTSRNDTHDWHVLENITQAGTRSTARLAGKSRVLSFEWDALLETERGEFESLWSNLEGGTVATFIVPNVDDPGNVFHGTIPGSWSESVDVIWGGIAFAFVQSGRAA